MRILDQGMDITLKAGSDNLRLDKALVLRFDLKGVTTNIDKLGIYYVNTAQNTLEFVGGKVDRASGEITAQLSHLSTYVLAEYHKVFEDIADHWAKTYIECMTAKHVIDGRTDTTFVPDDNVTRAEFAKIIVQALELELKNYTNSFEDVLADVWYAKYIQTAYDHGLIHGRIEGKVFDPNGRISRQEMMAIIGRAIAAEYSQDNTSLGAYKDVDDIVDYAKPYVAYLISEKIVSGYPDMTIRPTVNTTRAEAVRIVYDIYNR